MQASTSTGSGTVESSSSDEVALIPCVVCDEQMRVLMSVWSEFKEPAAVCEDCLDATQRSVIRQLYILRRQVRQIHTDSRQAIDMVKGIKQDFDELYQMHVELSERVG